MYVEFNAKPVFLCLLGDAAFPSPRQTTDANQSLLNFQAAHVTGESAKAGMCVSSPAQHSQPQASVYRKVSTQNICGLNE